MSYFYPSLQECRQNEFVSMKKDIIKHMEDLEQHPETSFEVDVMCEDQEAFCLSNDNIAALKLLLNQVFFVTTCLLIICYYLTGYNITYSITL